MFLAACNIEDLASRALLLRGPHDIFTDPATAPILAGIIKRAGGEGRIAVKPHLWLLPGEARAARRKEVQDA